MILNNEEGIGECVLMSLNEYNRLLKRHTDEYSTYGLSLGS